MIQYLVEQYPEGLKARDYYYGLPLHWIGQNRNEPSLAVLQLLIEFDPESVLAQDSDGDTVLHTLCGNDFTSAGSAAVAASLPEDGSKYFNADDQVRKQQLRKMHSARLQDVKLEMVQAILEVLPAALFIQDDKGRTPLDIVQAQGRNEATSLLDLMTRYATPDMTELQRVKKELASARAELEVKESKIAELEAALLQAR